jgi:hypothetical protein
MFHHDVNNIIGDSEQKKRIVNASISHFIRYLYTAI